jgi:hypothetical protein
MFTLLFRYTPDELRSRGIRKTAAFYLNSTWFHVAEIGIANDELRDPGEPIDRRVIVQSDKMHDRFGAIREGLTRSQAVSGSLL